MQSVRQVAAAVLASSWTLLAQSGSPTPDFSLFGGASTFEAASLSGGADYTSVHHTPNSLPCDSKKRGEIAAAPIPMVNPTLGDGMGAAALYLVNLEPCEPRLRPSSFAVGGLGTNNGTWAIGGGTNLVLRRDRYRITVGAGTGNFNYPFFGIGNNAGSGGASVNIDQKASAFLIEPKMRFFRRWYAGPRYHIIHSEITLDLNGSSGENLPSPPESDRSLRTAAMGLRIQNDTRDNAFYPRAGAFLDGTLDFYDPAFGGRRSYGSFLLAYNKYWGIGQKNVIAAHGAVCSTWSSPPFYDLCLLGMSRDLRGYEVGRYRDGRFLAAQLEYRRDLFWRFGAVVFMGAGEVGATFSEFNTSDILPGGGVGVRLLLAKRSRVNLRVDYAWGKGSNAFYVGLIEAF